MASHLLNSVPFTSVDPSSTGSGRYTINGEKWGAGGLGSGVTLTYSFPGTSASYAAQYGGATGATEWDGITTMSAAEMALARSALAAWSAVANISFVASSENNTTVGEIRIAKSTSIPSDEYAHAYLPSDDPSAGDVWLQAANFNPDSATVLAPGGNDFHTLVHEIGHALGLKHSFDDPDPIAANLDNYFYSVMSYSARDKDDSGIASFMPTTPMYYDLVGIQTLYGRNLKHNAGDTVFTYRQGSTYFETIDDAGGIDKIVYQGTRACTINLNQGAFSNLSDPITFDNATSRATVCIGPKSIIENATGGAGSDVITGNAAANVLAGGAGNDTIAGGLGNDTIFGNAGNDKLSGGAGLDRFFFNVTPSSTANKDAITDFNCVDDSIYLARTLFTKLAVGALNAAYFWTGSAAHDANDVIVYNKASGVLYYDSNGSAAGGVTAIATFVPNTTLYAADIIAY